MPRITAVLAENRSVFQSYLQYNKLNPQHFAYINRSETIRGYSGVILTVGRWWRNDNYEMQSFRDYVNTLVNRGVISIIAVNWETNDSYIFNNR